MMILRIPSIALRTRRYALVVCAVATPHQPGAGGRGRVTTRGRRGGKGYTTTALFSSSCCLLVSFVWSLKRMLQVVRLRPHCGFSRFVMSSTFPPRFVKCSLWSCGAYSSTCMDAFYCIDSFFAISYSIFSLRNCQTRSTVCQVFLVNGWFDLVLVRNVCFDRGS